MASSSYNSIPETPKVPFGLLTPRIKTDCERCLGRVNGEADINKKRGLLTQLFVKQLLSSQDIFYSNPDTLKQLSIQAIMSDIIPTKESEKKIYVTNIKKIYDELFQRSELKDHEERLITEFLTCYYRQEPLLLSPRSQTRECIIHDDVITREMRQRPLSQIQYKNPDLLNKDPMQWLFRVLKWDIPVSKIARWPQFIHPEVFIVCYKAFTTTELFLEAVCEAIKDTTFSLNERKKVQNNLIFLLGRWLSCRYYLDELSENLIKTKFEEILSLLEGSSFDEIKKENQILQILFEKSLTVTPRAKCNSVSLESIADLLRRMVQRKDKEVTETACQIFAKEIHCYFVRYIDEIPINEYFCDLTTMKNTPHLARLACAINKFEEWLYREFMNHTPADKMKFEESIIYTMGIARQRFDFQTPFSLKNVLDRLKHVEKRKKDVQKSFEIFQNLFQFEKNIKHLREAYSNLEESETEYFPVLPFLTRDLTFILGKPQKALHKGIEIFDIQRFNLIYEALRSLLALKRSAPAMIPKTNLQFKIWSELGLGASSSSISEDHQTSK